MKTAGCAAVLREVSSPPLIFSESRRLLAFALAMRTSARKTRFRFDFLGENFEIPVWTVDLFLFSVCIFRLKEPRLVGGRLGRGRAHGRSAACNCGQMKRMKF